MDRRREVSLYFKRERRNRLATLERSSISEGNENQRYDELGLFDEQRERQITMLSQSSHRLRKQTKVQQNIAQSFAKAVNELLNKKLKLYCWIFLFLLWNFLTKFDQIILSIYIFISLQNLCWTNTRKKVETCSKRKTWTRWIASLKCQCLVTSKVVKRIFSYFIMDLFTAVTHIGEIAFIGVAAFSEMESAVLDLSRLMIRSWVNRELTLINLKKLIQIINMKRLMKN